MQNMDVVLPGSELNDFNDFVPVYGATTLPDDSYEFNEKDLDEHSTNYEPTSMNAQEAPTPIPSTPTRNTTGTTAPNTPVSIVQVPVDRKRARDYLYVPDAANKRIKHSTNVKRFLPLGNNLHPSLSL